MGITTGRWRVDELDEHELGPRVVDEQDVTVAIAVRQPLDPEDWAEGNANLIAAAPKLNEALGCLYGHLENLLSDPELAPALLALEPGLHISMAQALTVLWEANP